jgi:uncharacterized protein (TIGR03435 family)
LKTLPVAAIGTLLLCGFFDLSQAQSTAPLAFEVASVKVADQRPPRSPMPAAGEITGGPGTSDPTRINYKWILVRRLLMTAFAVPLDQLSGSEWVMGQDARFDIVANVPPGTTKEQTNEMLFNLLKERFHLTFHREKRDFDMYALVVAKGGPKLKEAAPADGPPPSPPEPGTPARRAALDRDGFPQLPPGRSSAQGVTNNGVSRFTFRMSTPQTLLGMLSLSLGRARTEDKTGLSGQYDFTLEFSQAGLPGPMGRGSLTAAPPGAGGEIASDPAPNLFSAIEKQLGLKLEKSKTQLDVVVIDHFDKTPTEN